MRASQMYAACVHATQCSTLCLGCQVHLSCSHAQILGGSTHSAYVQNMVKISAAYTPHMSWLLTLCVPHACSIFVRVTFQYEAKTNVGRKEIICPCDCDLTIGDITYNNLNLHGADSLLNHHPEQDHT